MLNHYELGDLTLVKYSTITIVMQRMPGLDVTYAGPVLCGPVNISVMSPGFNLTTADGREGFAYSGGKVNALLRIVC